eukprot:15366568-Ditylum_brightwellii.AAC.1
MLCHFDRTFVYAKRGSSGVISKSLYQDIIGLSETTKPQSIESWQMNAEKELYDELLKQMNATIMSKSLMHLELTELSQKSFCHPLQNYIECENTAGNNAEQTPKNDIKRTIIVKKAIDTVGKIRSSFSTGDGTVCTEKETERENDVGKDDGDEDFIFSEGWQKADAFLVSESHEMWIVTFIVLAVLEFINANAPLPFMIAQQSFCYSHNTSAVLDSKQDQNDGAKISESVDSNRTLKAKIQSVVTETLWRNSKKEIDPTKVRGRKRESSERGIQKTNCRRRHSFADLSVCRTSVCPDKFQSTEVLVRQTRNTHTPRKRHSFGCPGDQNVYWPTEVATAICDTDNDLDGHSLFKSSEKLRAAMRNIPSALNILLNSEEGMANTSDMNYVQVAPKRTTLSRMGTVAKLFHRFSSENLEEDTCDLPHFLYTTQISRTSYLFIPTKKKVGHYLKPTALRQTKSFSGDIDALDLREYDAMSFMLESRFKGNTFLYDYVDDIEHITTP